MHIRLNQPPIRKMRRPSSRIVTIMFALSPLFNHQSSLNCRLLCHWPMYCTRFQGKKNYIIGRVISPPKKKKQRNSMSLTVPYQAQVTLLNHAKNGQVEAFQQIVDTYKISTYDLESTICDEKKNNSLHFAAYGGHSALVNYLVNQCRMSQTNNMFGDTPFELASRPGNARDPQQQELTIAILKQDALRRRAQQQSAAPAVHHVTTANRAAQQQQPAAAQEQQGGGGALPPEVNEVLQTFAHFQWTSLQHDYCLSGLLPYAFKGNTYFTPVDILRSKNPAEDFAQRYRCRVQIHNLNGLVLSLRAVSLYLDPLSGAVRPTPPFSYPTLLHYVQEGVISKFAQCPPLADPRSQSALVSLTQAVPIEILMRRVASGYHDGTALRYNVQTSKFEGVIPVASKSAAVPVHVAVPHDTNSASSPVVIVVPTGNFALKAVPYLDMQSGQVLPHVVKSLREWSSTKNSYEQMGFLFRELELIFGQELPIREANATAQQQPATPAARPAPAASPAQQQQQLSEDFSCILCLSERRNVMLIPCKHLLFCRDCLPDFIKRGKKECPVCRQAVSDFWEIYT